MSPLLLSLATFWALALVTGGTALVLARRRGNAVQSRLAALGADAVVTGPVSVLADDGPRGTLARLLMQLGRRTQRETYRTDEAASRRRAPHGVRQRLVQAGFRRPGAFAVLTGARVALAAALLLLGLGAAALVAPALSGAAFAFAAAGWALPGLVVGRLAAARRAEIRRTLPDALDLLILCVEAGLGLNAALLRVAEERCATGRDALGDEIMTLSKELQVGLPRREALRSLADRTGSEDVRLLTAQIIQSERLGSSIAQALRAQAESIRLQRRLEAKEAANKIQVKLLFPLILFIFPCILIVILMPAVLRLMSALTSLM